MDFKYVEHLSPEPTRYWEELHHKFADLWRVALYVVSFCITRSSLISWIPVFFPIQFGANHPKYLPAIKAIGNVYAVIIPLGFVFIAIFHYVTQ